MNKEEHIAKYGKVAYTKMLAQSREWRKAHPEEVAAVNKVWRKAHPEKVIANQQEEDRKGGKYYKKHLLYKRTGLQGRRKRVRLNHGRKYRIYKKIIDPLGLSQIHHEWIPETADYRGVALVEADQHMHGIVDVIQILEGKIILLTEEEIRGGGI